MKSPGTYLRCAMALAAAASIAVPAAAPAQEGRRPRHGPDMERPGAPHEPGGRPERGAHDRRIEPWHGDIRHFRDHDFPALRAGRWFHGARGGREGWWWIVGLNWYWYPVPVYPYPDPYLPPPAVIISPAPPATPPYWYYCADPPGYYPYVPQCYGSWERLPATPP